MYSDRFTTKEETKALINDTVNRVFEVVTSTMGPNGKVVIIQNGTGTTTTKDGATVARAIEFKDDHMERVNRIIAEAATKTEEECGDGTTTTIFLTKYLYDLLIKYPGFINQKRIAELVDFAIESLKKQTVIVEANDERIYKLALTTANQDESIARKVADIYATRGENLAIEIKEGNSNIDQVIYTEGQEIHLRLADNVFSVDGVGSPTTFKNTIFVMVNKQLRINSEEETLELMAKVKEIVTAFPNHSVAFVGIQMETSFVSALNMINMTFNKIRDKSMEPIRIVGMKTNAGGSFGNELMGDIGTILNAVIFPSIKDVDITMLNACYEHVNVHAGKSVVSSISEETKTRINKRVELIEQSLINTGSESFFSPIGKLARKRITLLNSEIVNIYVGGETSSEIKERKDRFDDVTLAVQSALTNGILPGCGLALGKVGCELFETVQFNSHKEIEMEFVALCQEQFNKLVSEIDPTMANDQNILDGVIPNMATGSFGKAEDLGVYDTAYASITALKGGFSTAKILANASSVVLTNKAGAIRL